MFTLMLTDRLGHAILDDLQSHHNLGQCCIVFRSGLLLQLCHRRAVRRLLNAGNERGDILVHDNHLCYCADGADIGNTLLYGGRKSELIG